MKVIVQAKKADPQSCLKAMLVEKEMQRWLDDQPEDFFKDLHNLTLDVVGFNAKWGTQFKAEDINT